MTVTTYASGTQTATINTEHFLSSPNVIGEFELHVDLNNMTASDRLEIRVYSMGAPSGTSRVMEVYPFAGAQLTDQKIMRTSRVANSLTDTNALRYSLKQTHGTGRAYDWSLRRVLSPSTAEINAEVVDGLAVDTYAETSQSTPAATATLAAKISFLYKLALNKITQDATTLKLFASNGTTVDQKSTVSDDGTTFTRGAIVSGP